VSLRVVVLRGRTSDRSADGAKGAQALGEALSDAPRLLGEPGAPRDAPWQDDLRDGAETIAAAGHELEAALDAGEFPVLLGSDCTFCMGSLPVVARRLPDARLVWLDAHGDFNTPETTASGFLGGMCLSAVCGRWSSGFGAGFDPARVVLADGRDLDAPEREEMERAGLVARAPGDVPSIVRGAPVFLHVDLDVLDPSEMPFSFPAHGGMSMEALRALLLAVAQSAEVVGLEVASIAAPGSAARVAAALEPVLPR